MPEPTENVGASDGLSRYSLLGLGAVSVLVIGLGVWLALAEISGAVIAPGTVVVESNSKRVQHPEGGTVTAIFVRDEDEVAVGQPLLQLDTTSLAASLAIVTDQLDAALIMGARLEAEVNGVDLEIPEELRDRQGQATVAELVAAETRLLSSKREVQRSNIGQLQEQVTQLRSELEGLNAQRVSVELQFQLVSKELEDLIDLQSSQLVQSSLVSQRTREKAALEAELAGIDAGIGKTRSAIGEREIMVGQVGATSLRDALTELQATREKIAELRQQRLAGVDRLQRATLIAPQAGIVHDSVVRTIGGVVAAGETLMMIVPSNDELVIEAKLDPLDVDKVHIGQEVIVRVPGLPQRTTPDLVAHVVRIAPDLTTDTLTGMPYFHAEVRFAEGMLDLLPAGSELRPGMPAEAFVQTEPRSILNYLVSPLIEQFRRALRES